MKLVHTYFLCQDCEIKCCIQLISKPSLINSVYYYLFIWQFRALSAQLLVVDWFFLSPYLLENFYTNFFIINFVWHYILGLTETTWVRASIKKSEGKKKRKGGGEGEREGLYNSRCKMKARTRQCSSHSRNDPACIRAQYTEGLPAKALN